MKQSFFDIRNSAIVQVCTVLIVVALFGGIAYALFCNGRMRMRDKQRLIFARELALALRLFEIKDGTFLVVGSGEGGAGFGYAMQKGVPGYQTAIISTLKRRGYYGGNMFVDEQYGNENFYITVCDYGRRFDIYLKLEDAQNAHTQNTLSVGCGGVEIVGQGFNYRLGAYSGGFSAAKTNLPRK